MNRINLTGKDIIGFGAIPVFTDLADGDVGVLEMESDIHEPKKGFDGEGILAYNAAGETATLTLRVLAGSENDKYLNGEFARYKLNPDDPSVLQNGKVVKKTGANKVKYTLTGGAIKKLPSSTTSVEGNMETGVAEWTIFFFNVDRSIK